MILSFLGWAPLSAGDAWIATLSAEFTGTGTWPCSAAGATLIWSDTAGSERRLTEAFEGACDPALDPSGENLYFAGRRGAAEDFRIWRLHLPTNEVIAMTPEGFPARNPFVLPDGSLVFLSRGDLFRLRPESEGIEQLTFARGRVRSAAALPDGRILFLSSDGDAGRLFSMLPDGTWTTLWPGFKDASVRDFAIVDPHRLLVLDAAERLFVSEISDPYGARQRVSIDLQASLRSLHRASGGGAFLLAEASGKSGGLTPRVKSLHLDPEPRLTDLASLEDRNVVALDAASPPPPIEPLPSIVKREMETGYLFVIDVARTDDPDLNGLEREAIAELRILRLEESGSPTFLSAVEPAADGSIFLEAPADTPLALELIDQEGTVLARTRTPIWVRPNERRGCLGCHVSPAYAPPNVQPQALIREPHRVSSGSGVTP